MEREPLCCVGLVVGVYGCKKEEPPYKHCKIAFASHKDGESAIYTMNADGSRQKRLTKNRAHNDAPHWSPSITTESETEE
jgi:hypothetical protein